MENIHISTSNPSNIAFGLTIEGLPNSTPDVYLIIDVGDYAYLFTAVMKNEEWHLTIPPLSKLTNTKCTFSINVIADQRMFNVHTGIVEVDTNQKVTITPTKKTTKAAKNEKIKEKHNQSIDEQALKILKKFKTRTKRSRHDSILKNMLGDK